MAQRITESDLNAIERIMDKTSLALVLHAVATICYLKAQHVREAWQDESLARRWQGAANLVDGLSNNHRVKGLP